MKTVVPCPLCGEQAALAFPGHEGFRAPETFDLFECPECQTSFCQPLEVDPALYDLIYRQSDRIAGYERYRRYRTMVRESSDPLGELARSEDLYWAIREIVVESSEILRRPLRILDVGSGLGYLVHALRRAGHEAEGLDISSEAVAMAAKEFGPHYRVGDLRQPTVDGTYDLILATELIEHVPDPTTIVATAVSLLEPGGALVVTTPNRDLYPQEMVWHTEPPPVHLWWFSKTSLRYLAWSLDLSVRFTDFSRYYGQSRPAMRRPSKPATLGPAGEVIFRDRWDRRLARRLVARMPTLFRPLARRLVRSLRRRRLREQIDRDSLSLCAVFRPSQASAGRRSR